MIMEVNIFGSPPPIEEPKKVWGFVCCHTELRQGARAYNLITEYDYCYRMLDGMGVMFATRNLEGLEGAARVLSVSEISCTIEPHFNAFDKKSEGMTLLILEGDSKSYIAALDIVKKFKAFFPRRNVRGNGVTIVTKKDNGYYNLKEMRDIGMEVAILSELFFGDNEADFMPMYEQARFWKFCLED